MIKRIFALSLLICLPLTADSVLSEDKALRRINDHLILKDINSAAKEAEQYCSLYPDSFPIQQAYLRALCEKGEEQAAFSAFKKAKSLISSDGKERELLELMAWGVLSKGETSSLLMIRFYSLLGAAFTSDAKALPLLQRELASSNALLRSLAVKISASYGDIPLRETLLKMLKDEKVWYVRLDVIAALGRLRVQEARPFLKRLIANPKTLPEERASALMAMTAMYETVDDSELSALIHSDRAGFRQLAIELISFWNLHDKLPEILPLLSDNSPSVRMSVLNALGQSGLKEVSGVPLTTHVQKLLADPCPEVAITAGWLATILGDREGQKILTHWITQPVAQWKRLSSAALAATGQSGQSLSYSLMQTESDIYVKSNLAIGLIGQRHKVDAAGKTLHAILSENKSELWMWQEDYNPLFRSLAPSKLRHIDQVPRYPYAVDQHVRLELLSVLSIIGFPKAIETVKEYLKDPAWNVSTTAMLTLLQEGDDQSLENIKDLLKDDDKDICMQAALILSMYGSDPAAIDILYKAYPALDREMKIHVLEALARIGDPSSIPFLLALLEDPFQVIRVIAASAMIQCIYH